MRFSKYNHEGYHDPTVYEAFTGIEEERKQEKQAVKQLRASYAVYRPIVYICSPYAGDVKQNVRRHRRIAGLRYRKTVCPSPRTCCSRSSWTTQIRAAAAGAVHEPVAAHQMQRGLGVCETISQGMASENPQGRKPE